MIRWNKAAAAHLHRRAGFGADAARIARSTNAGLEATLEELLGRREHSETLLRGVRPILSMGNIEPLQAWWMSLIMGDGAPLMERIALMWHDHFATSNDKVDDVRLMHGQVQLFREQGLGDFRVLFHSVATDPAMLVWLDGNQNRKKHPNENFAREVLELFGLGIGNYTEQDIQEAARAFSGWGVKGRSFLFRAEDHDGGEKVIFGQRGAFSGHEAIDLILAQPACARHVVRRLLAEFIHPEPTEGEVDTWTRTFVEADWNVERTLRALLTSELFFSDRARGARISGPVEMIAGSVLALGASVPPADAARAATEMGQSLYRPPSVKGWDGGRTWIHAGTWLARHNNLTALTRMDGERLDLHGAYGSPRESGAAIESALALLLPDGCEASLPKVLKRAADEAGSLDEALRRITALILTSPEYHLI